MSRTAQVGVVAATVFVLWAPDALAAKNPGAQIGKNVAAVILGLLSAVFVAIGGAKLLSHWAASRHEQMATTVFSGLLVGVWILAPAAVGALVAAIAKTALNGV